MSKKQGRRPFGYYDDEAAVIEQIFIKSARRPRGKKPTLKFLADSMNRDGYKTQTGRPWYAIAVSRILARARQPAKTVKRPKVVKKKHLDSGDYLTKEEVVSCRAVLRDSDRALFEVLLGAGLRASECCALEVQDIGIYGGRSQIDVRRGKGSKQRAVKIGPKLKKLLTEYVKPIQKGNTIRGDMPVFLNNRRQQMKYSDLYFRIRKIRARSGVAALHPHALRHTFATFLYNYKKDLEYVRQQLGHDSIATTQIYVNTLSEEKLEQMRGFEGSFDP